MLHLGMLISLADATVGLSIPRRSLPCPDRMVQLFKFLSDKGLHADAFDSENREDGVMVGLAAAATPLRELVGSCHTTALFGYFCFSWSPQHPQ